MGKIISGFLGIVLTLVVVSGTAFAQFSSQVTVSGINLTAGSADLRINNGTDFVSSWDLGGSILSDDLYPGYQNSTTFELKNQSPANIALAVSGQLTAATNWPNLEDAVEVAVNTADDSASTGWHSLAQWNAGTIAFPGPAIADNQAVTYKVYIKVPQTYDSGPLTGQPVGNEIDGQTLTNVTFVLTGTQQ